VNSTAITDRDKAALGNWRKEPADGVLVAALGIGRWQAEREVLRSRRAGNDGAGPGQTRPWPGQSADYGSWW
jgi:hypothetical protein